MTTSQLSKERVGEHALELGGIEGAGVLSGALEGVGGRVEVAGKALDVGVRGLDRVGSAGKGFDFLQAFE